MILGPRQVRVREGETETETETYRASDKERGQREMTERESETGRAVQGAGCRVWGVGCKV